MLKNKKPFPFLVLCLGIGLISSVLWFDVKQGGYQKVLALWFVDSRPYFQDLRVLIDGISQFRDGDSPYLKASSPFNYPCGWALLSVFSFLNPENLKILGLSQIIVFFILCLWLVQRLKCPEVLSIPILFSPPVLLALERGNCDVLIFILLGVLLLATKNQSLHLCGILSAALLKIFPLGAILSYLVAVKDTKTLKKPINILVYILFGVGLIYSLESFLIVSERTPRPVHYMSYGLGSLPSLFAERAGLGDSGKYLCIIILYAITTGTSVFLWRNKIITAFQVEMNDDSEKIFFAGVGCFLMSNLIGFNWEYRLIFLILCLPEINSQRKNIGGLFWILYALILLLFWQSFIKSILDLLFVHLPYQTNHFYTLADIINIILFIITTTLALSSLQQKTFLNCKQKVFRKKVSKGNPK